MPKRLHPADVLAAKAASEAVSYVATLFVGSGRYERREAKTLERARRAAQALMKAHPTCSRRPLIYGLLANGSQALVPEAGFANPFNKPEK